MSFETQNSINRNLVRILDENNAPVARMRLFSDGIAVNNRIRLDEALTTGDRGCLACGNCIDACPVVREKRRFVFVQNQRTSMCLENIVGDECRRCHACVRACPQVSKAAKEFVMGFRRGEKVVHAYTATLIFLLMATGIYLFHFREFIPVWEQIVFRWFHFGAGCLLLFAPVIYYFLDKEHMKRTLVNGFRFGPEDLPWMKDFWVYIRHPSRFPLPSWKEFNPYHRFWIAYLFTVVPLLGLTGFVNFIGNGPETSALLWINYWVHTLFAMMTDGLILIHLYFKLLRRIFRDIGDMATCMKSRKNPHYPFLYDPKNALEKFGRISARLGREGEKQ